MKMHTLLDLRGNIPTAIIITDGKVHDVKALDNIMIEAGAIYILWIEDISISNGSMLYISL